MIPEWHKKYVGLPFAEKGRTLDGVDCWGLVYLIYNNELGVALPSYTEKYATPFESRENAQLIADHGAIYPWIMVQTPQLGDVVLIMRTRRTFSHVGLYLGDNWFIHTEIYSGSCCENVMGFKWRHYNNRESRIAGFYRHAQLAS